MTPTPPPDDLRTLLGHEPFVRRVAARLLADDADVDDVVQETWVRAIGSPPRDAGATRPWLGAVARNLALNVLRGRRRRDLRERAAARPEARPAEVDAVERLARHREVVEAVLGLPEPLRATVTARYYDGRSFAEIAAAAGTTVPTVRARLRRAAEMLRARLAAPRGGELTAWLAPLALPSFPGGDTAATSGIRVARVGADLRVRPGPFQETPPGASGGHMVVSKSTVSAAVMAVVLVLAGGSTVWLVVAARSEGAVADPAARNAPADEVAEAPVPSMPPPGGRAEVVHVERPPSPAAVPPRAPAVLAGAEAAGGLRASGSSPKTDARPFAPHVRGSVVDVVTGEPVHGARVHLVCWDAGRISGSWYVDADPAGKFGVGPKQPHRRADRFEIRVRAPGYRVAAAPPEDGVTLRLERLAHPVRRGRVVGIITDAQGRRVSGRVNVGGMDEFGFPHTQWTTAGMGGAFVLEGVVPGTWWFTAGDQKVVDVTVPEGGEARVHLRIAGDAPKVESPEAARDVRVRGLPGEDRLYLRLVRGAQHEFWRMPVRSGRAEFNALQAGTWRLVLEREDRDEKGTSLDLVAGDSALEVEWAPAEAR